MKIQGNGHTLAHFAISMIFEPCSISDPTWGCPQDKKLTKTEKVFFSGTNTKSFTISEPCLVKQGNIATTDTLHFNKNLCFSDITQEKNLNT